MAWVMQPVTISMLDRRVVKLPDLRLSRHPNHPTQSWVTSIFAAVASPTEFRQSPAMIPTDQVDSPLLAELPRFLGVLDTSVATVEV